MCWPETQTDLTWKCAIEYRQYAGLVDRMLREADRGKISLVGFVVYKNFEVRQKSIFD